MRPPKLIELMKANSAVMTDALICKISASGKCRDLMRRVPANEQKQYALEVFRDLTAWLSNESDSVLEQHCIALGTQRAGQAVPLSQVFWAVSIAREYLGEYMQQECLHEEPAEFWDGVMLLRSLNSFFDRVLYFALVGYEKSAKGQDAALSYLSRRRSA